MTQPQKKYKDRISWGSTMIFLIVALLIHGAFCVLFRGAKAEHPAHIKSGKRSNYFISGSDPVFAGLRKKWNALPDPAEMIHGSEKTGYSLIRNLTERSDPSIPPLVHQELPPEPVPPYPAVRFAPREPGEMFSYPDFLMDMQTALHQAAGKEKTAAPHYPLWLDATGKILNITDRNEDRRAALFASRDITGPTELQIVSGIDTAMPPEVRIRNSSGNLILDLYAKQLLTVHLVTLKTEKNTPPRLVRIFWRQDAPVTTGE